nr:hypothetical protein HK105_005429 [Polyrhizophydium stewartii]
MWTSRRPAPGGSSGSSGITAHGGSHWDRLPRELVDMVVAAAGPLTQFVHGRLLAAELTPPVRQQVWAEALASEWGGDLRSLPAVSGSSECMLAIGSRGMLARAAAAGVASHWILQRVAVARGWADLVDTGDTGGGGSAGSSARLEVLCSVAAAAGALWLLEHLVDERGAAVTPSAAVAAAAGGHLAVVAWLHARRPAAVTQAAMDAAAHEGHAHVAAWLAAHAAARCTRSTVLLAAAAGRVAVLDALAARFPAAVAAALGGPQPAAVGDARALRWLLARGIAPQPQPALAAMLARGDAAGAAWACDVFGIAASSDMLAGAVAGDHGAAVRWLLRQRSVALADDDVAAAVRGGCVAALAAMIAHDARCAPLAARLAVERGDLALVEWLHIRHPGSIGQQLIEAAAALGHVEMIALVLKGNDAGGGDDERPGGIDTAAVAAASAAAPPERRAQIRALVDAHMRQRGAGRASMQCLQM